MIDRIRQVIALPFFALAALLFVIGDHINSGPTTDYDEVLRRLSRTA